MFHHRTARGACAIHEALGHDALPLACRQFPRVTLRDPRGVSLTLSAYCPTAAALLDDDRPVAIVDAGTSFPRAGEYVGLDADVGLPPLLSPAVLMDWESWWEWERMAVDLIANGPDALPDTMARLRGAVADIRSWRPGDGPLIERVRAAIRGAPRRAAAVEPGARLGEVLRAIPDEWRPAEIVRGAIAPAGTARRFVAAHAFANWHGHLAGGLTTWMHSVDAAFALVDAGVGVRDADLLLRHLADPQRLANAWRA